MSTENAPLIQGMRKLIAAGHERSEELKAKADALDAAINGGDTRTLLGAWARARRLWCEITGEELI